MNAAFMSAFFYQKSKDRIAMEKSFPDGMTPLGGQAFRFSCHKDVPCFTRCCKQVEMTLYPYDILRLKRSLQMESGVFLQKYVRVGLGGNPYFPSVMLQCTSDSLQCPFLAQQGCTVYAHRPSACRTYPLERAVDRNPGPGDQREFYFLTDHAYCRGHQKGKEQTVRQWIREQELDRYNLMNDLYGELDTLFSANPWKGEGYGGKMQQLAFMVCYDIDGFAGYVHQNDMLSGFRLNRQERRDISEDQEALLTFGFEWLKLLLGGKTSLMRK